MGYCCTADCSLQKKRNKQVWALMALVFVLGVGLALGGGLAGRDCFQKFKDCRDDADLTAICLDAANDSCGLGKYIGLISAGLALCVLVVPIIGLYFCCCNSGSGIEYQRSDFADFNTTAGKHHGSGESFNVGIYPVKEAAYAPSVEVVIVTPPQTDVANRAPPHDVTAASKPAGDASHIPLDKDSFGRKAVIEAVKTSPHAQNVPGRPLSDASSKDVAGSQAGLARISRRTTLRAGTEEMNTTGGMGSAADGQLQGYMQDGDVSRAAAQLRGQARRV